MCVPEWWLTHLRVDSGQSLRLTATSLCARGRDNERTRARARPRHDA